MEIVLIICLIGTAWIGFIIMEKIDGFIDRGGFIDSPQGRTNQGVLIYGSVQDVAMLQKRGIKCTVLTEPECTYNANYSMLLALSFNDAHNLSLCHDLKQADPGIYIVVRCNTFTLHNIYADAGADYILGADESIEALLSQLWGLSYED